MRLMSHAILAGTLVTTAPVAAQDAADPPALVAAEDEGGLADIVVTARRREENLQETPISITAFSGDALAARQANTIADIGKFTPNMSFESTANLAGSSAAATVFIRGVGQTDFNLTIDPGVGLYLDGVYISRSIGALLDTLDLERVEVLRGPQGTLFGKNTIGGAVSLTSRAPGDTFEGALSATTGRYERLDINGSLNVPIASGFAIRGNVAYLSREGYVRRLSDGGLMGNRNTLTGRIVAALEVTPDLTFTLALDGTRSREQSVPTILLGVNVVNTPPLAPGDQLSFNFFLNKVLNAATCGPPFTPTPDAPSCFTGQWITGDPYTTWASGPNDSDLDLWGLSLTAAWRLGAVDLKSITAYRDLESDFALETDAAPVPLAVTANEYTQRQFSQELQLSGRAFGNRLDWLVGLFYLREEGVDRNSLNFSVADFLSGGEIANDSYAGFAQLTYRLTDQLRLTAGARYTYEKKRFLPDQLILNDRTMQLAGPMGLSCILIPTGNPGCNRILPFTEAETTAKQFTPAVTLDYRTSGGILFYGSYSKGFKSGGFTQRVFPPEPVVPSFSPEFVENYEVGVKSELFDRRLRLNGAVFSANYSDLQIVINEGVAPKVRNAGRALIRGAELEFDAVLASWLRASGGVGYTDAQYREVDPRAVGITRGSDLPNAPRWTANAGVTADLLSNDAGALSLRGDWSYKSGHYKDALNSPLLFQSGVSLFNASATFRTRDERYTISAGVTNLTDEAYLLSGYADPVSLGLTQGVFSRPREWFVRLGTKF